MRTLKTVFDPLSDWSRGLTSEPIRILLFALDHSESGLKTRSSRCAYHYFSGETIESMIIPKVYSNYLQNT